MDGNAQNEVAQGNTMLSDMREHNREVVRHNLATQTNFNNQILQAKKGAREQASDKKAQTMGEGLGEGGAQALKLAKQGYEAYGKVQGQLGYQGMGRAEVAGRTAVQVFKDAPVCQAVQKTAGAVTDVAEAAKPVIQAVGEATAPARALGGIAARSVAQSLTPGRGLASTLEESTARTLGEAPQEVGRASGSAVGDLTDTAIGTKPSVLSIVKPATKTPLETAVPKVEGAFGKGIDFAEKGGALLNIASGGMDAIEDAVAGHVMGHNKDSKAGNELGIAGGIASLAGFAIPGMGLIGAGLGIASGIESMIGSQEHSATEISKTLPAQEKSEEESTVKYSGPTAESTGQVTQAQTSAVAKTGGTGASAF